METIQNSMIEIPKETFFKTVHPLDVVLSLHGNYPYKGSYKLRNGKLIGEHYGIEGGNATYFVTNEFYTKNIRY